MTPKEKAEELFIEFLGIVSGTDGRYNIEGIAKQCALKAIDAILSATGDHTTSYWELVKEEIEKL